MLEISDGVLSAGSGLDEFFSNQGIHNTKKLLCVSFTFGYYRFIMFTLRLLNERVDTIPMFNIDISMHS